MTILSQALTAETDAVVIGAGPAGLFSVFTLGMAQMRCHVVDSREAIGGQLTALYPEKPIYDIPGFSQIKAGELIERLKTQGQPFQPRFHLNVTVDSLVRLPDRRWEVGLSDGQTLIAPVVIIAAGVGAFGPQRPPLATLDSFEGKSVLYHVERPDDLAGKRVVIAGGGDSAVDWAIALADVAARIMVVHRRAKFRAAPASEQKLKELAQAGKIELVTPYGLASLAGTDGRLESVTVETLDGEEKVLPADILLAFFGLASNLGPIARWGLLMDGPRIQVDPSSMATNLEGVFALGDIASYPGKLKLILQGFSEAALAAHAAYPFAHGGAARHVEHSTQTGVASLGTSSIS